MVRRRAAEDEDVLELAVGADWRQAAVVAVISVLIGTIVVPILFSHSAMLFPLGIMFRQLAWIVAFVYGCLAVIRFLKQRKPGSTEAEGHARTPDSSRPGPSSGDRSDMADSDR